MTDGGSTTQHAQVIARAWQDPAYKQRLLTDPHAALAEEGLAVPPGVQVQVHENTPQSVHLVLPPKPAADITQTASTTAAQSVWCVWCAPAGGSPPSGPGGGGGGGGSQPGSGS